ERIGTGHIVVVRISSPPDNSARAILGARNGLELYLDEAVLDVGVVLQQQGVSGSTGLFDYLRIRRRRLVRFDRPFWITLARLARSCSLPRVSGGRHWRGPRSSLCWLPWHSPPRGKEPRPRWKMARPAIGPIWPLSSAFSDARFPPSRYTKN